MKRLFLHRYLSNIHVNSSDFVFKFHPGSKYNENVFPPMMVGIMSCSRDDEADVREAVEACAAAVGRAVTQLSAVMDVLLPVLRGEVYKSAITCAYLLSCCLFVMVG